MDTEFENIWTKSVSSQTTPRMFKTEKCAEYVSKYRKTFRLKDKLMRFQLHKDTLQKYSQIDLIPKGLLVHLTPSFGKNDPEFMSEWESILHNCSLNLMELIVKQCEKIYADVEHNLENESSCLGDYIDDPEEFQKVHNTIDQMIKKRQCHIQKIKKT